MSDNNLPKNENEELENAQETVNEVNNTPEEVVEETVNENDYVPYDMLNNEDAVVPNVEYATSEEAIQTEEKKPSNKGKIAVISVSILLLIAICVGAYMYINRNPYNSLGYVNVSGRTVQQVAESAGMTLPEFLEKYKLPTDMPADTSESAAYYTIPTSNIAQMYGMDFATLKSTLKLPDTITETTAWGVAEGEASLGAYIGEEQVDEFKKTYKLDEKITSETKWKEVRNIVDKANLQQRLDKEKADKNASPSPVDGATDATGQAPQAVPAQ